MKLLITAVLALVAFGPGCDMSDRPTNDPRVPKSEDSAVPPAESGGEESIDSDTAPDTFGDQQQPSYDQSRDQTTSRDEQAVAPQTVERDTMTREERKAREGRRVASKKAKPKKRVVTPVPSPMPEAGGETSQRTDETQQQEQEALVQEQEELVQEQTEPVQEPEQDQESTGAMIDESAPEYEQMQSSRAYSQLDQYKGRSLYERALPVREPAEVGVEQAGRESVCSEDANEHAAFLRSDIAYAVTGEDCVGDPSIDYTFAQDAPAEFRGRQPASSDEPTCANQEPWSHAPFLRQDIAYGVLGEDCFGTDRTLWNSRD